MASETTNYQLVKPDPEEFYDVRVPNGNMDKIDTALKALSEALDGIDLVTLSQAISNVDQRVTTHLAESMPHQYTDGGKTYKWGLGAENSVPYLLIEEVI